MTVNMAYVSIFESGTKFLKKTARHSSNFRKAKAKATAFLKCLQYLEGLVFGVVIRRKTLSKSNILQENDHAPCQVSS